MIGVVLGLAALYELNGKRGELTGASAELGTPACLLAVRSDRRRGDLLRRVGPTSASAPGRRRDRDDLSERLRAQPRCRGDSEFTSRRNRVHAALYSFRFYRRTGADATLAGWVLLATLVCSSLTLCLIAAVGVALAFGQSSSFGLVGSILTSLVLAVLADALVLQRRWLHRLSVAAVRASRRLLGHPTPESEMRLEAYFARLGVVRMSWLSFVVAVLWALSLWAFDCAALAASFLAVGAEVPWRGLLLTYGASQLAVNLPVTPGGLGVVEGTITIALVEFGGVERSIVPAVLCYRIVSFWGFLPVGWTGWAAMGVRSRRQDRAALAEMATFADAPVTQSTRTTS